MWRIEDFLSFASLTLTKTFQGIVLQKQTKNKKRRKGRKSSNLIQVTWGTVREFGGKNQGRGMNRSKDRQGVPGKLVQVQWQGLWYCTLTGYLGRSSNRVQNRETGGAMVVEGRGRRALPNTQVHRQKQ